MGKLSFQEASDLIGKWLSISAAICGGVIWLNTYVQSKRGELTERQRQSIEFFREYNNSDSLKLRQDFFDVKTSIHREVDPLTNVLSGDLDAALEKGRTLLQKSATRIILAQGKGFEMRRLVELFDQSSTCVEIGVCDRDVTYRFLGADAYEIRYLLGDFITQVRRTRQHFGEGLDKLADEPKE